MSNKRTKEVGSFENEETTDEDNDENESDSESEPEPEYLAPNRARRANAGNKMADLLKTAHNNADDFYGTAYGGFEEEEIDENFASPAHSGDEDEVDSDFDNPEVEEPENEQNVEPTEPPKKRINKAKEFEKSCRANINRANTVPENVCDPKTQQMRLREAKLTQIANTESLKKYQEIELERRKRQIKPIQRRGLDGPIIKSIENANLKVWTLPTLHEFKKPPPREYRVCAITGKPAKYIDPLTELPYADSEAFKIIRQSYKQFLKSEQQNNNSSKVLNTVL